MDVFTREVASAVLGLHADSQTEARIAELRGKANEGTLAPAEDAEYKDFVQAVDLISIIQTKTRRFLAKHPISVAWATALALPRSTISSSACW